MNLVTEQGRKAEEQRHKNVQSIKKEILSSLRNGIDLSPVALQERYHYLLHDEVREALFQLLDSHEITVTDRFRLQLNS